MNVVWGAVLSGIAAGALVLCALLVLLVFVKVLVDLYTGNRWFR